MGNPHVVYTSTVPNISGEHRVRGSYGVELDRYLAPTAVAGTSEVADMCESMWKIKAWYLEDHPTAILVIGSSLPARLGLPRA